MADEPKIFIDEGWKAQVQREREEAARKAAEEAQRKAEEAERNSQAVSVPGEAPPLEALDGEYAEEEEEGPVEASFMTLVASMATQAMFSLGVMAAPGARQVMVNLDQAKFSIDTLEMLQEKTRGNLTEEEQGGLAEAIAELQRIYVARLQQWQEQTLRDSGIDPGSLRGGL